MTVYNSKENQLVIVIPGRSTAALQDYRKSILSLLARVEIEHCNVEIQGDLKLIYELLSHLYTEEEFDTQQQAVNDDVKSKDIMLQS